MLHIWVISLLAAIVVHDSMPRALSESSVSPAVSVAITLGSMALLGLLQHLVVWAAAVQLRETGRLRVLSLADRTVMSVRVLTVLTHAVCVLLLGWVDAVRSVVGDLVMIDELLAMTPALLVISAGWWSYYPIERQFREATIVRDLDVGRTMYPIPTRWQWTFSNLRHQLLLSLVPIAIIGAWTESSPVVLDAIERLTRGTRAGRLLAGEDWRAALAITLQLGGAVVVFAFTPLMMRYVWDTVRLGPGPMREQLLAMCKQCGVRVRELLVWRTHGSMINGAVLGLAGPLRYVLLTDALLDQLPEDQVRAVMAHEIAHARHSHIPWLAGAMLASVAGATAIGVYALWALESMVGGRLIPDWLAFALNLCVQFGGLVGGVLSFGYVSRRFEWQADAFAARLLSASTEPQAASGEQAVVTEQGAASMRDALESVARLNHVPRSRASFRHGSIATRQNNLQRIVGTSSDRLPIDVSVRRIKLAVLVLAGVAIGSIVLDAWLTPNTHTAESPSHVQSTEIRE